MLKVITEGRYPAQVSIFASVWIVDSRDLICARLISRLCNSFETKCSNKFVGLHYLRQAEGGQPGRFFLELLSLNLPLVKEVSILMIRRWLKLCSVLKLMVA